MGIRSCDLKYIFFAGVVPAWMYRFTLLCSFSLFLCTEALAQSPYCNPNYSGQSGNCITYGMSVNAVEIRQGLNTIYSRAHNSGGYNGCTGSSGQYTLWSTSPMFTLKVGGTYSIGFTTGPTYAVGIGVWIDLNADNDFADSGEWRSANWCSPYLSPGSSVLQFYTLTIPWTAKTGVTRMRIRSVYNSCTSGDNGCTTYNYGEAEDFTINLGSDANDAGITAIQTPACYPQLKTTVSNLGNNTLQQIKIGWMVNGALQKTNSLTQSLAKGQNSDLVLSPDFTFKDLETYYVKVFTFDPNGVQDPDVKNDTSYLQFIYYKQPLKAAPKDVSRCGAGSVRLNAGLEKNAQALWFGSSNGTDLLSTDSIYQTPNLPYGTKTYYVESAKFGSVTNFSTGMGGTFWLGNVQSGNMFDLTAVKALVIDSFALNVNNYSTLQVNVYVKSGSYAGYQTNATAWTLIKTINGVKARGLGNPTTVSMDGFLMPAGSYGIYVQVSEGILFHSGGQSHSGTELKLKGGDAISGSFGTVVSNYTWSGHIYYRPVVCTESRVSVRATVYPTPAGSALVKGLPFQTTRPKTSGTPADPDIVASGDELNYTLQVPSGYLLSDYGKKWQVKNFQLKTGSGRPVASKYYTFKYPAPVSNGQLKFKPDSTLEDTIVVATLQLTDLGPYYCDTIINRSLKVAPRPKVQYEFKDSICDGETVYFENKSSVSSGNLTYHWAFGTGNAGDSSNAVSSVFRFPGPGNYTVSLTATSVPYGYKSTVIKQVRITEIPKVDFKVLNACEKIPVKFINLTTHSDSLTFQWDFGDPFTGNDKSKAKDPNWTYTATGGYPVTLTARAKGCTATLVKNANQFAVPKAGFKIPALICTHTPIMFSNLSTIPFGNMGYSWNFGDGTISHDKNPHHEFQSADPIKVKLKTISEFGCVDSAERMVQPTVSPLADFRWNAACNLTETQFQYTGKLATDGSDHTFHWNLAGEQTSGLMNPKWWFKQAGKKRISLSVFSSNGCFDTISRELNIKLQAKADFAVSDICEEDEAVFINNCYVSSGNLQYVWKFGDGQISGLHAPRHRYQIGGTTLTYNVTLVAQVPGGCPDSVTKPLTVHARSNSDFTYKVSGRWVDFKAITRDALLYQWRFGDGGSATTPNAGWHYLGYPSGKYRACLAIVNNTSCFSETCKEIQITGASQSLQKNICTLFPNPGNGSFHLQIGQSGIEESIEVLDATGKRVCLLAPTDRDSEGVYHFQGEKGIYLLLIHIGKNIYPVKYTLQR